MRPKPVTSSTPQVRNANPSPKEIEGILLKALQKSQNHWLKEDVKNGNVRVTVDGNKIILSGRTDSPISRQDAFEIIRKKAEKNFNGMEIVSYLNEKNYPAKKLEDKLCEDYGEYAPQFEEEDRTPTVGLE